MSSPRYWAVVPAAGVGSRVGAAVPKQYLPLRGRAVIDHALDPFLDHPAVEGVVLALSAGDGWWLATAHAGNPRIRRVEGGAERCHSVLNALDYLAAVAAPEDWVLVHDAARPCLRREDLDRLMAIDPGECGGLLARPIHDTVKRSGVDGRVAATLPREDLWRAFTPQMFRLQPLRGALRAALESGAGVTDDASAMELAGFAPVLVEGHGDNLKITRPEDLELAAHHLEVQGR